MIPIRDRGELAAAQSQVRAFIFMWVDWSMHARNSRALVEEVVAEWQSDHPDQALPCYVADLSNQCGEVWSALTEWLTAEGRPARHLMVSGVGSLLWVRSGHVVIHVLAPLEYGVAKLMTVSRSVFESGTESATG